VNPCVIHCRIPAEIGHFNVFHDGFCRYNTQAYEWVIMKTGWTGPVQGVEETTRLAGGGRFDKPVFSGYGGWSI
jgi:hypothetical protein